MAKPEKKVKADKVQVTCPVCEGRGVVTKVDKTTHKPYDDMCTNSNCRGSGKISY